MKRMCMFLLCVFSISLSTAVQSATFSNKRIGEITLYLSEKMKDDQISLNANAVAAKAFIEEEPQKALNILKETTKNNLKSNILENAGDDPALQKKAQEYLPIFTKFIDQIFDGSPGASKTLEQLFDLAAKGDKKLTPEQIISIKKNLSFGNELLTLLIVSEPLMYTKRPDKISNLQKRLPQNPSDFEDRFLKAYTALQKVPFSFDEENEHDKIDETDKEEDPLCGLASIELHIGCAWLNCNPKESKIAKAFLSQAIKNTQKISNINIEDKMALLKILCLTTSAWPELSHECFNQIKESVAKITEEDKKSELETLEAIDYVTKLIELGFTMEGGAESANRIIEGKFAQIKTNVDPQKIDAAKKLKETSLQMIESGPETLSSIAILGGVLLHRYGLSMEAKNVIEAALQKAKKTENTNLEVIAICLSKTVDNSFYKQAVKECVNRSFTAETSSQSSSPTQVIRTLLSNLARLNDGQTAVIDHELAIWLESKIESKIEMLGDRVVLYNLLTLVCSEDEINNRVNQKMDQIIKEYPENAKESYCKLLEILLIDAAPFDSSRAQRFSDMLTKEIQEWEMSDKIDLCQDIFDNLELTLSGVPHRSEWEIELNNMFNSIPL